MKRVCKICEKLFSINDPDDDLCEKCVGNVLDTFAGLCEKVIEERLPGKE